MICELRTFDVIPGRMPAIHRNVAETTMGLWERHGMKMLGCWTYLFGGRSEQLVILFGYDDLAHRERAWTAFQQDPDWLQFRKETSLRDGPLHGSVTMQVLQPTAYSPLK